MTVGPLAERSTALRLRQSPALRLLGLELFSDYGLDFGFAGAVFGGGADHLGEGVVVFS